MFKSFIILFLLITSLFAALPSSKKPVEIGIIAFRPIQENQHVWQPLADELNRFSKHYDYRIHSYSESDLEKAVAHNKLDFIIVHSLSFITMETKYDAQNIASLIRQDVNHNHLTHYGGVIAVKANRSDIKTLSDIRGKMIATTHKEGFAVYLMPLDTLMHAGVDMRKECRMLFTGQPQERVLNALRSGKADVAFFRTGYIEELIAKGKLNSGELKIINPQPINNAFHYLRSTPLYPEWSVASTTRPDTDMIKETTIALYQINATDNQDFHAFANPLSYKSTRDMMQNYHIYPFDTATFTFQDVLDKYSLTLIIFFIFLTIGGASFTLYYIFSSRQAAIHTKQIESILSTSTDGIHVHDDEGNLILFSDSFAEMLGYTRKETAQLHIYDWDHHFDPTIIHEMMHTLKDQKISFETVHTRKDGTLMDVEINSRGIVIKGVHYIYASARDITERKRVEQNILEAKERFDRLAHHDPLTALPNRLSLIEKLQHKTSGMEDHPFALFFLDLDGFKEVNDSYGHRFGDTLLIHFSSLIKEIFPPESFIVRTGGDEFVIVLGCQKDQELIQSTMNKLIDILNHPFHIEETDIYITASVGIAMYPNDALTTEDLLQRADAAMYNAKKMGKNTYSFYSAHLTENALYRTTIATNLKKALAAGKLQLYFQPQVNAYTNIIIGVETLLRWFTPNGQISPAIFIPIAEETGLIQEIGDFVLRQGCQIAAQWAQSGLLNGRIAINVSARQLVHPNFLSTLEHIIQETNCNPSWIELEITESSILENPEKIILLLRTIKNKGFTISIDDFGTGYSSLSYLKNLPIDKLKIDISFIRNITHESKNQTIVKTIIALAKGLGMSSLAEGVETAEELTFLQEHGIDSVQGYYYYKPISQAEVEALLKL
ncbi:MAG: EAL domain-containing protein [Sulfuricurvum sp.]|uniref:EAL domain-containing protein n=1 Tax=Sulfuricurvum sp. TaxID=2025608 RepID=UPI00261FDBB6|nr:EAL domain-containing protein [Sulfuricurvum sp.]MDD5158739.1 EAL domain-containing protein [Sulfuricurvum sp.]